MEISELLTIDTGELIKFIVLALIVAIIAVVARRGQAHSTGAPPKSDHAAENDADHLGDTHSGVAEKDSRVPGRRR